jgi:hypothetical protein
MDKGDPKLPGTGFPSSLKKLGRYDIAKRDAGGKRPE